MVGQTHFKLSKWASSNNENCCSGEEKIREDMLQTKSDGPQLRHRSQFSGIVLFPLYKEDTVII